MTRTGGVNDDMFLNFFIWGLKLEMHQELLSQLINLADSMDRAQLYADRNEDLCGRFYRENLVFLTLPNNHL